MNLLQIELLKLGRLANYILGGLLFLFVTGFTVGIYYSIKSSMFSDLFNGTQLITGTLKLAELLLSIFIIINIGKEFSESTLRRSIIDGYTRDQFFQGKMLLLIVASLVVFGLFMVEMVIGGLSIGHMDMVKAYFTLPVLINTFLLFLTTGIYVFFLVMISRSVTMGLVLYFVLPIAEQLALGAYSLIAKFKSWDFDATVFGPLTSIGMALSSTEIIKTKTLVVAITYLSVMLLLSYWSFTKRDIK